MRSWKEAGNSLANIFFLCQAAIATDMGSADDKFCRHWEISVNSWWCSLGLTSHTLPQKNCFSELCLEVVTKLLSMTQHHSHGSASRHVSLERAVGAFNECRQDVASMKFNPRNSSLRFTLCDSKLKVHEIEFVCSVWNVTLTNSLRLGKGLQEKSRSAASLMNKLFFPLFPFSSFLRIFYFFAGPKPYNYAERRKMWLILKTSC